MFQCKVYVFLAGLIAAWLGFKVNMMINEVPEIPNLPETWWGPGSQPSKVDESIRPFKVEFKEEMIKDLQERLTKARFYTEPLEEVGFQYGFNNKYLKEVINFWNKEYKFKEREAYLNQYPHFKTNIQGLDIHYVHIKPKVTKNLQVYPLLLVHGWPGSFVEFYKIIPLLTKPREGLNFVFELIIPSIPGYGFSQGSAKTGMGVPQISTVMKNLMERLGFEKYIVQGGDWGSIITGNMAIFYPDKVYGHHSNMPVSKGFISTVKLILGSYYPSLVVDKEHESKVYPMLTKLMGLVEESGYMHIQATKPDTIGAGLRDSPIGLAAYILEKFSTWTNLQWKTLSDGGLTKKFTLNELLDNIMIYWVSESITTSVRLYSEYFNKAQQTLNIESIPIVVPSAVTRCANELSYMTNMQLDIKYKTLLQVTDYPNCGHFLGFEEPQLLANDIWSSVIEFRKFYFKQSDTNKQ